MKRLTILFITLSIAIFVWVGLSGINFIQTTEEEGFVTAPITRASDCNCLPGYIPSSETNGYNGKIFWSIENGGNYYFFNPDGTRNIYLIQTENSCGIPNINLPSQANSGNYTYLDINDLNTRDSKYRFSGRLQCNMLKKKEQEVNFFCQSLSNPEKRRNCY
jgi:hypothetical protein